MNQSRFSLCLIGIAFLIACQKKPQPPAYDPYNREIKPALVSIQTEDGRKAKGFFVQVNIKKSVKGMGGFNLYFITSADILSNQKSDYAKLIFDNIDSENPEAAEIFTYKYKPVCHRGLETLDLSKLSSKIPSKFGTKYLLMYKHIMDDSVDFEELKNALGLDPDTPKTAITQILDLTIPGDMKEFLDFP